MVYLELFVVFFQTGLFTIGGGLAMLPVLKDYAMQYNWVSIEEFYTMVAVAESTPGPIGVNMATYVGYNRAGVLGGIVATFSVVLPSLIVIIIVAAFFFNLNKKPIVQNAFYGIRPAVTGLIASAAAGVLLITIINLSSYTGIASFYNIFNWPAVVLFVGCYILHKKFNKLHPIVFILSGAVYGLIFL